MGERGSNPAVIVSVDLRVLSAHVGEGHDDVAVLGAAHQVTPVDQHERAGCGALVADAQRSVRGDRRAAAPRLGVAAGVRGGRLAAWAVGDWPGSEQTRLARASERRMQGKRASRFVVAASGRVSTHLNRRSAAAEPALELEGSGWLL